MYYHDDENHNNEYNGNADADGCGVFKSFITVADLNFLSQGEILIVLSQVRIRVKPVIVTSPEEVATTFFSSNFGG